MELDEACLCVCLQARRSLAGYSPGKAIALLDAAAARAVVAGSNVVGPDDVYSAVEHLAIGGQLGC